MYPRINNNEIRKEHILYEQDKSAWSKHGGGRLVVLVKARYSNIINFFHLPKRLKKFSFS